MRPGGGGDGTFDHGMGVRVRVVRCALGARVSTIKSCHTLVIVVERASTAPVTERGRREQPFSSEASLESDLRSRTGLAIVGGTGGLAQRALQRVLSAPTVGWGRLAFAGPGCGYRLWSPVGHPGSFAQRWSLSPTLHMLHLSVPPAIRAGRASGLGHARGRRLRVRMGHVWPTRNAHNRYTQ